HLTGLTKPEYHEILQGTKTLKTAKGDLTGGAAIKQKLSEINVEHAIEATQKELADSKNITKTDQLNKKLRYLDALKKLDLKPDEAYIRQIIPVIPAIHRPIIQLPGLGNSVAPANYLYQRLGVVNESFKYPVMSFLDDAAKKDLRSDLYSAARELAGFEPVETRGKAQPIEGFISQITNSQPKAGFFLSKVISKRQDLVGRGVITAAPDLHVDELGIPEKMAWKIFHPFTMREYTKAGVGADTARKEIEQKSPRAKQMLQAAMNNRTVLMNRAPSLHKFSIMAFKPVISEGLAVRVPPLVLAGFGGDGSVPGWLTGLVLYAPEPANEFGEERVVVGRDGQEYRVYKTRD
ncbi:MAG: hypothetical protein EBU84_22055, partial [Actinobacteria bacterium]|nr:hypothetical protein [Actinomycetota bacterium]